MEMALDLGVTKQGNAAAVKRLYRHTAAATKRGWTGFDSGLVCLPREYKPTKGNVYQMFDQPARQAA